MSEDKLNFIFQKSTWEYSIYKAWAILLIIIESLNYDIIYYETYKYTMVHTFVFFHTICPVTIYNCYWVAVFEIDKDVH